MKYRLLLIFFITALASSVILSTSQDPPFCIEQEGCQVVTGSEYGYFLGIENSYYGIVIFALLSLITYWHINHPHKHKRNIIHLAIMIGSAIAIYFIYLQVFVLKSYCTYCMIVDIGLLIALIVMIILWEK